MKMKMKSHPAEVAALAAVVRWSFEKLGRPVPADAEAALALVERWVGGEAIPLAAFEAARAAAHQDGVPFEKREKDRPLLWALGAAGNLAWMAGKPRGWAEGSTSVIDAASYVLSSAGIDVPRAKLVAIRAKTKVPGKTVAIVRPKMRRVGDELAPFLGAKASARLRKLKAFFDPAKRGTEAQLRELLGKRCNRHVMEFESRYGGLLVPDDETEEWLYGAYACLTSGAHDVRGKLVPVVYSPNDIIYFLDADGLGWARDTIAEVRASRFADDGDAMVTRILLG